MNTLDEMEKFQEGLASAGIAQSIEKIAQMVEENSAASKETAGAAQNLENLAQSMTRTASWFKTS
ncbi:MAG: hypothetical protein KGZ83_05235 [Sulfuricella sp.]|nr:hypothetical protein [Sulfuricella sp.]